MQPLVTRFGERILMILLDVFAIIILIFQTINVDLHSLYITRFLLGIYLGISSNIIPVYLISISPPEMAGLVGSFNQLLITIGISVAYKFG
jgi:MFS family permease